MCVCVCVYINNNKKYMHTSAPGHIADCNDFICMQIQMHTL